MCARRYREQKGCKKKKELNKKTFLDLLLWNLGLLPVSLRSSPEQPCFCLCLNVNQSDGLSSSCWIILYAPIRKRRVTFEPGRLVGENKELMPLSSPDSPFKLPLKRKLQQRLWCEADMLRDILRECRCALDYHSNESVLMSFNRLRVADERRAISAPCRGDVHIKK